MSSRVTAVLLPLLLSLLWVGWLLRRPEVEDREVSAAALELDQALDQRELDVLVLGNSAAKRNIDARQLGQALDRSVLDLGLSGTLAPTWYVLLRDRVYGRGLAPRLVVIADTPPGMLALQPSSPRMHTKMMELASGLDPIEEHQSWGGPAGGAASRIATRSSVVRTTLVDGLRNTMAGLLFAGGGEGTLQERGQATADAAVAAVLGDGGTVAAGLEGAMSPVVRRLKPDELELVQGTADDSFLRDIVELVQANGGQIVFVHLPRRNGTLDPGAFEGRASIVEFLNARSVPYVDLSRDHTDAALFMDNNHMSSAGKAALTTTLSEALASRVLGGGDFEPTVVPGEQVRIARVGDPPPFPVDLSAAARVDNCTVTVEVPGALSGAALAALRVHTPPVLVTQDGEPLRRTETDEGGCSGTYVPTAEPLIVHPTAPGVEPSRLALALDPAVPMTAPLDIKPLTKIGAGSIGSGGVAAYWVYPGTTLRFEFPRGWAFEDGALWTSALVVQEGSADATLTAVGRALALRAEGRVLRVGPEPVWSEEPWTVEWSSPADGPWLLVRDLEVGPRASPIHVVGSPTTSAVTASFLPSEVTEATVSFAGPPPELVGGEVKVSRRGEGQVGVEDGPLLSLQVANRVAGKKACSPINIDIEGKLFDGQPGKNGVQFDVSRKAARYAEAARPVFHPERRCTYWPAARGGGSKGAGPLFMAPLRTARWVYPGDVVTFSRPDLLEMHGLGSVLVLEGFRMGPAADLVIEVAAGGGEPQRFTLPMTQGAVDHEFALPVPLDPRSAGPVSVTLRTTPDDAGFVYVTDLHLAEAGASAP